MSEIESLTSRIKVLSDSIDLWNLLMLWGLALAGVAAVFVFIATRIIVSRTGELSTMQDLRNEAKDRQLQNDLKDKDGKIADAQREAGNAKERASAADERASKNEKEAAQLRKEAEDERMARIQLATSIAWRTPDRALIPGLASPLKPFSGQRYCFVADPTEPERTSVLSWVVILLGEAKWNAEPAPASNRSELTFGATNIVLWVSPDASNKVLEAARALVPVLERGGLPAVVLQSGWGPRPYAAPPELLRVVIFKKGPRMTVTGNVITFEGSPTRLFFGEGPPH